MQPIERNARFSNPLVGSSSPYLRQHAHNPVFWYPWGKEAIERARSENKPILLSIGYSTCYWCHVMEREVFENLSIASLMNRLFINVKVDREEHPQLDEIYMVARQMMTHQGGWPNNVFLTPDLMPFFAGGTYAPDEAQPGRPSWPRLLEWLQFSWTTQEGEVRKVAADITKTMLPHLVHVPVQNAPEADTMEQAAELFALLKKHHDVRAGGFFQAPKFPHECYLDFLTAYHEYTGNVEALDMATRTLQKMASGGMYDQVGCGFHRYAIDADWLVPHFEKMLYNQAQLARNYVEGARLTDNAWLADIARSILEYVGGPLTDGQGAFYSAIDAETDGVEGAYYTWTAEQIQEVLEPGEAGFFIRFFAMADVPQFPGHPHSGGQTITLRKPLDIAARDHNMPYAQVAAMAGAVMNKLLTARNQRKSPIRDDKIIVGWNGLMIDAFAHAGRVLNQPQYVEKARKAADFILEKAIDNEGRLHRIYANGKAQHDATLEDYAYLVRGLISLYRAAPQAALLESATSLMARAGELFMDGTPGYFFTQPSDYLLVRGKSGDDGATISPNAAMLHNLVDLAEITGDTAWLTKAKAQRAYFMNGKAQVLVESAGMLQAALKLEAALKGNKLTAKAYNKDQTMEGSQAPGDIVSVSAALFPANAQPGENCELILTLEIKEGWHINANKIARSSGIPTQVTVEGKDIAVLGIDFPEPLRKPSGGTEPLLVHEGMINITARLKLAAGGKKRPKLKAMVRFQPCSGDTCHAVQDVVVTV